MSFISCGVNSAEGTGCKCPGKMLFKAILLVVCLHVCASSKHACRVHEAVLPDKPYPFSSPGWPQYYEPDASCWWKFYCPGYRCRLTCSKVKIPKAYACWLDHLQVSPRGSSRYEDSKTFCGKGTINVLSTNSSLSMRLIPNMLTKGGKFKCQVTAEIVPPLDPAVVPPIDPAVVPPTAPAVVPPTSKKCTCGEVIEDRIVEGNETGINQYPSMAAILDLEISSVRCGGSIISPWFVLTAAHCVSGESPSKLAVLVGEHDLTIDDSPYTKQYAISSFTIHPKYTDYYDYDIALIKVVEAIVFNNGVGPVCLPFKFQNKNVTGHLVILTGWGSLKPGGPSPNALHQVEVEIIHQNVCQSAEPKVTERQICTYNPGRDACTNDSGGPLLYMDQDSMSYFTLGVISYGIRQFCGSGPGANTRLTSMLDWITQNTPQTDYCIV